MARLDARSLWRTYLVLLLIEGALRKWVFPSLATPLLLIRDLVGAGVLAVAWRDRVRIGTPVFTWLMLLGGLSAAASFIVCPSLAVTLYGWRTDFFVIPVVYAFVRMLDEPDAAWCARLLVGSIVPMTLLVAAQALFPGSAWVNRGAGEDSGQIMLAGGFVRASGTFSFVTGLVAYYPLALWAILYARFDRREIGNRFAFVASAFLLAGVALTGSRFLLGFILLAGIAGMVFLANRLRSNVARTSRPRTAPTLSGTLQTTAWIGFAAAGIVLTPLGAALGRFGQRIALAEGSQSSADRMLVWLLGPFEAATQAPPLGYGLGLGTSVGSALATGKASLLFNGGGAAAYTEIEGARHIFESGPVLGTAYFLVRLAFAFHLFFVCRRLTRRGLVSAWCLWAVLAPGLVIGQMGQPTALGFLLVETVLVSVLERCEGGGRSSFDGPGHGV